MVLKTLKQNSEKATKLILAAVPMIAQEDWSNTADELKVSTLLAAHQNTYQLG